VQRAVIMCAGKRLAPEDLELNRDADSAPATSLKKARESLELEMIQNSLRRHSGKITAAAAELGISRPTLYELMAKLGIQKAE
jgi:two-component system NtrC family response regulator